MRFIIACILNAVSADSPCYGMLASCCLPRKEEELKNAVRIEYQNKLQVAFEKRAGQKCKRAGRNFERKTKPTAQYTTTIQSNCSGNKYIMYYHIYDIGID